MPSNPASSEPPGGNKRALQAAKVIVVGSVMFTFILTGPTSGVSAGSYIMGLLFRIVEVSSPTLYEQMGFRDFEFRDRYTKMGSVVIACGITFYFFRQNILGIHESSDKALWI